MFCAETQWDLIFKNFEDVESLVSLLNKNLEHAAFLFSNEIEVDDQKIKTEKAITSFKENIKKISVYVDKIYIFNSSDYYTDQTAYSFRLNSRKIFGTEEIKKLQKNYCLVGMIHSHPRGLTLDFSSIDDDELDNILQCGGYPNMLVIKHLKKYHQKTKLEDIKKLKNGLYLRTQNGEELILKFYDYLIHENIYEKLSESKSNLFAYELSIVNETISPFFSATVSSEEPQFTKIKPYKFFAKVGIMYTNFDFDQKENFVSEVNVYCLNKGKKMYLGGGGNYAAIY